MAHFIINYLAFLAVPKLIFYLNNLKFQAVCFLSPILILILQLLQILLQ